MGIRVPVDRDLSRPFRASDRVCHHLGGGRFLGISRWPGEGLAMRLHHLRPVAAPTWTAAGDQTGALRDGQDGRPEGLCTNCTRCTSTLGDDARGRTTRRRRCRVVREHQEGGDAIGASGAAHLRSRVRGRLWGPGRLCQSWCIDWCTWCICFIALGRPTAQSAAISRPSRRGLADIDPTVLANVIACRIPSVHVGNSLSAFGMIPLNRHELAVTGAHGQ